jgi:hypothetical protein
MPLAIAASKAETTTQIERFGKELFSKHGVKRHRMASSAISRP